MTENDVFQIVKQKVLEVLPFLAGKEISIQNSLKDLGANSIDRVEIATLSMEHLEVKIPPMEFSNVTNLEGLVKLLHSKIAGTG